MKSGEIKEEECRKHPVYDDNKQKKEDFICLSKSGGGCEEIKKCPNSGTLEEDKHCSDFAASDENKGCVESTEEGSPCKEIELCGTISRDDLSDSDCNTYPVSYINKDTHICIKDPENNKCSEKILCENVDSEGENKCSDFPVKLENSKTHVCIKTEDKNKCEEIEICSEMKSGETTDEECRKHPVYDDNKQKKEDFICINKSGGGCEEKELCPSSGPLVKGKLCSDFPTSVENKVCVESTEEV